MLFRSKRYHHQAYESGIPTLYLVGCGDENGFQVWWVEGIFDTFLDPEAKFVHNQVNGKVPMRKDKFLESLDKALEKFYGDSEHHDVFWC
mgnify:CR=1 FL=1